MDLRSKLGIQERLSIPTTWPVVSKLCLEAPVEVVGKVKGASAVESNLRPDLVPKTGLPLVHNDLLAFLVCKIE